jgi:hypothetical protein
MWQTRASLRRRLLAGALAAGGTCVAVWIGGCRNEAVVESESQRRVEFVVVDAAGEFVPDIRPEECEIVERGTRVTPLSFVTAYHGRLIDGLHPVSSAKLTSSPPVDQGTALGRIVVVVIDDLSFQRNARQSLKTVLEAIRSQFIAAGTVFSVVSTGPSAVAIDLTYDLSRYDNVLRAADEGAFKEVTEQRPGPDKWRASWNTLKDILRGVGRLKERRKAIILISSGYEVLPTYRNSLSSLLDGVDDSKVWMSTSAPAQAAAESASPLTVLEELLAAAGQANAPISVVMDRAAARPQNDGDIDTGALWLRVLAHNSTGAFTTSDGHLATFVQTVDRRLTEYYVVTYQKRDPSIDTPRDVSLTVARPGTSVLYRRWQ